MVKNIIIINDFSYVNGGASRVALESAKGLSMRGFNIIFFSSVGLQDESYHEDYFKNINLVCLNQYEIINDPYRIRAAIQGLWNFKAAYSISKILETLSPTNTVIHIHSWTKSLSSSIIRVIWKEKFPIVITLHDYFIACPNGLFFDFSIKKNCSERPLSFGCIKRNCDVRHYNHKIWRCIRQLVQNKIGKIPSAINCFIFVSEFSRMILEKYLPEQKKIYLIRNPINIQFDKPTPVHNNNFYIYTGRLSKEKGVIELAKAFKDKGSNLIFVGDGECKNEILHIIPNAKITGWVSPESVKQYLKISRALILPSLCYETQGAVVMEAAALGIPSIVPDTCAAREFVIDGQTGLWFKGGDFEDMINKINLLEDENLIKKLGEGAFNYFWGNPPTLQKHINELIELYEGLL